jgi:hypothetical protein
VGTLYSRLHGSYRYAYKVGIIIDEYEHIIR